MNSQSIIHIFFLDIQLSWINYLTIILNHWYSKLLRECVKNKNNASCVLFFQTNKHHLLIISRHLPKQCFPQDSLHQQKTVFYLTMIKSKPSQITSRPGLSHFCHIHPIITLIMPIAFELLNMDKFILNPLLIDARCCFAISQLLTSKLDSFYGLHN